MPNDELFNDLNFNDLYIQEDNETSDVEDKEEIEVELDKPESGTKKTTPKKEEFIEVEEEEKPETISDNENEESDNTVLTWTSFYKEKGLIPEDVNEEEITDFETLFEKLQEHQLNTAQQLVESYKASLPKEIKDLVETWEEGASGEAFKKILETKKEQVELKNITEDKIKEDAEFQKSVLKTYLKKTTKYDDAKIDKYIKRVEDLEELEEEALSAGAELKTILEQEETTIRNAEKERVKRETENALRQKQELEEYIKTSKSLVADINFTESEKKAVQDAIMNPVGRDKNGNPVTYLQNLINEKPKETMVTLNYLAVVTKGFTDWTKLVKRAETKATKKIDALLETAPPKTGRGRGSSDTEDWKENLKRLKY